MKNIQPTYCINEHTCALIPAKSIHYDTIVIERNATLHIRQTPLQIIDNSCQREWTTYEGRKAAVMMHTNFRQKIPLPINIHKQIHIFPTHSPTHIDNCWIVFQNIIATHYLTDNTTQHPQTIFQFKGGQSLAMNISKHILKPK